MKTCRSHGVVWVFSRFNSFSFNEHWRSIVLDSIETSFLVNQHEAATHFNVFEGGECHF